MSTSHLWQLAETHALFDWSYVAVHGVNLTLEGPKPLFDTKTSLENLDNAIRISAEGGWLKMLGIKEESWDDLKRWIVENWGVVVDAAAKRLGEGIRSELEALRDRLNDDKIARKVVASALLLIQAERLGVNEETLKYFGAVISGAISGGGHAAAPRRSRSASFPGCICKLQRPPDEKRPPTLVASKPPTRRNVHIRAAGSTRQTASRAFAAENNTCANPRP